MEFEYTEPEYDEVEDSYKIRASREDYERESARLLKGIAERDELKKLLKLAKPEKIAAVRKTIAQFDKYLESQEKVTETSYVLYQKRQEMWRHDMKTMAMINDSEQEFRKHIAEHSPEKLELLDSDARRKRQNTLAANVFYSPINPCEAATLFVLL